MFNLLVKFGSWADGRDTLPVGRLLQYTDDAFQERFAPDSQFDFDALMKLPCLFVEETRQGTSQVARVGAITDARIDGREVKIEFAYES